MTLRAWGAVLAFAGMMFGLSPLFGPGPALAATPSFPPLTGRVVDDAHVLSPKVQADLTAKLKALEEKNGDQLVVVTLPSLQGLEIEDYGYQLGRAWGIGHKGKNNGVLFIVAPSQHKVRIEVGYGLEPELTDALSSVILQSAVLPKFRAGDVPGGVVAGTDAIIQQLGLDPDTAQANAKAAEAQTAETEAAEPASGPDVFSILGALIFPALFVVIVILGVLRSRGGALWVVPFLFMGGGGGSGDGGGGGSSSDDDSFSGDGGSFGGGGSSGSW